MSALPNYAVFPSLKTVIILGSSVDPDKMLQSEAFHLRLHCLPKLFTFFSTSLILFILDIRYLRKQ